MAKIQNDKYYTSPELAKYCVGKTKEIIGEDNIVEYVEPSAGSGVFLNYLDKPYIAYDIEPEDEGIIKADFLKEPIEYKKVGYVLVIHHSDKVILYRLNFLKNVVKLVII